MPVVHCPHCSKPASLPDTWSGSAYTCPHCRIGVAPAPPVTSKKPVASLDFDTDDEEDRSPVRRRARHSSSSGSGVASWVSTFTAVLAANLVTAAILMTGVYLAVNHVMNRVADKLKETPAIKAK